MRLNKYFPSNLIRFPICNSRELAGKKLYLGTTVCDLFPIAFNASGHVKVYEAVCKNVDSDEVSIREEVSNGQTNVQRSGNLQFVHTTSRGRYSKSLSEADEHKVLKEGLYLREDLYVLTLQTVQMHVFVETRFDDIQVVDVLVSNGVCVPTDKDANNVSGEIFYKSLYMEIPSDRVVTVERDRPNQSDAGDRFYLVAPLAGGKDHYFPVQAMFWRRFALCRSDQVERARKAVRWQEHCRLIGENSYESTAAWGPFDGLLANIDQPDFKHGHLRGYEGVRYKALLEAQSLDRQLKDGSERTGQDYAWGPFHGERSHNAGGGMHILSCSGHFQCPEWYQVLSAYSARAIEDMPVARTDSRGDVLDYFDVGPTSWHESRTGDVIKWPWNRRPGEEWNSGDCPYYSRGSQQRVFNTAHLVRAFHSSMTLSANCNHSLSKLVNKIVFTSAQFAFTTLKHTNSSVYDKNSFHHLKERLDSGSLEKRYGHGSAGRQWGWPFLIGAWVYACSEDRWRKKHYPWFEDALEIVEAIMTTTGATRRREYPDHSNPNLWTDYGAPRDKAGVQRFEEHYVALGVAGIETSVTGELADGSLAIRNAEHFYEVRDPGKFALMADKGGPAWSELKDFPKGGGGNIGRGNAMALAIPRAKGDKVIDLLQKAYLPHGVQTPGDYVKAVLRECSGDSYFQAHPCYVWRDSLQMVALCQNTEQIRERLG